MRGNYQEETPMMKFAPEAAGMSDDYQTQQYIRPASATDAADDGSNIAFAVIETKSDNYNELP